MFAIVVSSVLCHSGLSQSRDIALSDAKLEQSMGQKSELLLVGSSRVYRHFDCEIIQAELDEEFSVYNLGVQGMWPPREDRFLDRVLNDCVPKVVIVELNPPQSLRGNVRSSATLRSLSPSSAASAINTFCETSKSQTENLTFAASFAAALAYKYLGFGLFRTEFLPYEPDAIASAVKKIEASDAGFLSLDKELTFDPNLEARRNVSPKKLEKRQQVNIEKYSGGFKELSSTLLAKCEEFIKQAKNRNCRLVFFLSPRMGASQLRAVYPVFEHLDEANRIDMSDPRKYPEFYDVDHSFDDGHLNEKGAAVFSRAFAIELKQLLNSGESD